MSLFFNTNRSMSDQPRQRDRHLRSAPVRYGFEDVPAPPQGNTCFKLIV